MRNNCTDNIYWKQRLRTYSRSALAQLGIIPTCKENKDIHTCDSVHRCRLAAAWTNIHLCQGGSRAGTAKCASSKGIVAASRLRRKVRRSLTGSRGSRLLFRKQLSCCLRSGLYLMQDMQTGSAPMPGSVYRTRASIAVNIVQSFRQRRRYIKGCLLFNDTMS